MRSKVLGSLLVALLVLSGCTITSPGEANQKNGDIPVDPEARFTIQGQDSDGNYLTLVMDSHIPSLVTILEDHFLLHEGRVFSVCQVDDLSNGANVTILFRTPPSSEGNIHLIWEVEHELEASTLFYEGATVTANGTEVQAYNRNRNSTNLPAGRVFTGPTVTSFGTLLCETHEGSGNKAGGSDRPGNEWELEPDTNYLLIIKNQTTLNNVVSWKTISYKD